MNVTREFTSPYDRYGDGSTVFEMKDCPVCGTERALRMVNIGAYEYFCPMCHLSAPRGDSTMRASQFWMGLVNAIRGNVRGWGAMDEIYKDIKFGVKE